jgi:hypothetical protein
VYAISYDVPGDEGIYQRVKAALGDEPAKGLIVQMVVKRDGDCVTSGCGNQRSCSTGSSRSAWGPPSPPCSPPSDSPSRRLLRRSKRWPWSTWPSPDLGDL